MRMYVIGNQDAVLGFSLVGVSGRVVRDTASLEKALSQCMEDKTIGLVLVTSDVSDLSRQHVDTMKATSLSPLVIEIPGEATGASLPSMKELVQQVLGVRLGGD